MVATAAPTFDIDAFLAGEHAKDLLRFTTAGSVDDGKSTLIGRLLYDSRNVYEDQLRSIAKASTNRSAGNIDFSLLTDGLRAEREQGITIDVAYRYFATARRKFIIADTPGHEQYTRNMATGASTAELAIILIDARNGALPQSRRHAYIASLLGIPNFVVAVNKMDLAGYDEAVFAGIQAEFAAFLERLPAANVYFIPISALAGENVVTRSRKMRWFRGPSLLEHLETVPAPQRGAAGPFRFPVQRVVRPDHTFRGYAGQIASGAIRAGDAVVALPSGRRSRVESIVTFDGPLAQAHAPMSVTLTLADELDVSRGDVLAPAGDLPEASREFEAMLVWMDECPLDPARRYILKHGAQQVSAELQTVLWRVNIGTLEEEPAAALEMNAIGAVRIETSRPLFFDPYRRSRGAGSFILIDAASNATVGAGMILNASSRPSSDGARRARVTTAERLARFGHRAGVAPLGTRRELAYRLERTLFERGCAVSVLEDPIEGAVAALRNAGLIVLLLSASGAPELPPSDDAAAAKLLRTLADSGVLSNEPAEEDLP